MIIGWLLFGGLIVLFLLTRLERNWKISEELELLGAALIALLVLIAAYWEVYR